jgi:uncharacterized UBP type Zn finger protein
MRELVDLEQPCKHVSESTIREVEKPAKGCVECLKSGSRWVHLRECLTCGHVGCCDSSPNRHARAHHKHTQHPIIGSAEPGETWAYCYADDAFLSA